jgi:GH24 family phage-related lysozyme (muramidase)
MTTLAKQKTNIDPAYNLNPDGRRATWDKIYMGYVKDNKDARFMGRLKVYIPELCGPEREEGYIVVEYASPFAGATNLADVNLNKNSSQTDYGMTFIPPDVNNMVVCAFINGDPNRGIWFGCLWQMNANKMTPSTPATSSDNAPHQDANKLLVSSGAGSPDFLPGAEFADTSGVSNLPVDQGGHAEKGMGNSYTTNGIRTPRGHNLVMEDDPQAGYIRLQTRHRTQIILHDNEDKIIISTGSGNSRIELDREGRVDIYAASDFSVHAGGDINLVADHAINMESGAQTRVRSRGNLLMWSDAEVQATSTSNFRVTSQGEFHRVVNGSMFDTITSASGDYNLLINSGNIKLSTSSFGGNIDLFAGGSIHQESFGGNWEIRAGGFVRVYSYNDLNMLSLGSITQEASSDVNVRADGGVVKLWPSMSFAEVEPIKATDGAVPQLATAGSTTQPDQMNFHTSNQVNPANRPGAERSTQSVSTIASRIPGADPWADRTTAGPGFRNLVQRKDGDPENSYLIGQIGADQTAPLGVMGIVNGGTLGRYRGVSWDGSKTPQYNYVNVNDKLFKKAREYTRSDASRSAMSEDGFKMLKDHEGFGGKPPHRPGYAYPDHCTALAMEVTAEVGISGTTYIGYGHIITSQEMDGGSINAGGQLIDFRSNGISPDDGETILIQDLIPIEDRIRQDIGDRLITQYQFDALCDFIYNVGLDAWAQSKIANLINADTYNKVPNEMIHWILACGQEQPELKARRVDNCYKWSGEERIVRTSGSGGGFNRIRVQGDGAGFSEVTDDAWGKLPLSVQADTAFRASLNRLAARLNCAGDALLAIMQFETGNQWSTGYYGIGTVGLIQFTRVTEGAPTYINRSEAATMTRAQQVDGPVTQYFTSFPLPVNPTVGDLYMAVAAPGYVGKPGNTEVYAQGTAAYNSNPSWRGADGRITVASIKRAVGG